VEEYAKTKELKRYTPNDDDLQICRCMFDMLGNELYQIWVPFVNSINWTNCENRRNLPKFQDIIRAVTFFSVKQRECINGCYVSTIEDFDKALLIYTGTSKNNATNLSELEREVFAYIIQHRHVTLKDVMTLRKVSHTRALTIMSGRDGKGGLLAKVLGLNKVDRTTTKGGKDEDKISNRETVYEYTGCAGGLEIYDTVAVLDTNIAAEEIASYKKMLAEESVTTVTQLSPNCHPPHGTVKPTTLERVKACVTLKRENDIEKKHTHVLPDGYEKSVCCDFTGSFPEDRVTHVDTVPNVDESSVASVGDTSGTVGDRGDSNHESHENNSGLLALLRKALVKFARDEYKGIVPDLDEFIRMFNAKVPEYKKTLGPVAVGYNAKQLHMRGWR
jgi:hypothetical protein